MATQSTIEKKKKKRFPTAAIVGLALTGSALVGGYIAGVVFYHGHYFPQTTIGGISCGNQTADYVESRNIRSAEDYLLTIYDRKGSKFHVAGMDFDYKYISTGEEAAILDRQSSFTWPAQIFQSHEIDLNRSFSYDQAKLSALVEALPIFDEDYIEAPENAYLDITDTGYEIVPEVMGSTPVSEEILAQAAQAVDGQKTEFTLTDDCYVAPEILSSSEQLVQTATQLDSYMTSTVTYDIDGVDEKITPEKILSFLDIDDNGSVTVNEGKVSQYVQYLASTYNTYADVREFATSNGDTVRIGGGDYGWVISKKGELEQILADLAGGVAVQREPVYEQRAVQSGIDDIGSSYVEIDYTNQHLWYYREGELVIDTDIVSGNISRGLGSPDGVFKIVYCERDAVLVGEDYSSPVKYFMPFAYNVGIHDASWRNKFGDEIYKRSGSHGCINVPEEAAKTIIDTIDLGTPVIAYYREPVKLSSNSARISNAFSYVDPDKE